MENMIKVIKIGTTVQIHNRDFKYIVTKISFSQAGFIYLVNALTEDGAYKEHWIAPCEITSQHKEYSIINQCIS